MLEQLERDWDRYDVFVVNAPTGCGKSVISKTISDWCRSAVTIVPTNLLVDQYRRDFPDMHTLARADSYQCPVMKVPCSKVVKDLRNNMEDCQGCAYTQDLNRCQIPGGVFNFYMYLARKLYQPVVIIDEAHTILKLATEMAARKIPVKEYGVPRCYDIGDVIRWLESVKKRDGKLNKLYRELTTAKPSFVVSREWEMHRGVSREILRLVPLDVKKEPPLLWPPRKKQKLIMMSATIGRKDIEDLGLDRRRVCFIETSSPIPAAVRPVYVVAEADMSAKAQERNTPRAAEFLKGLAELSPGKGVIHATYGLAQRLRPLLADQDRFMFHGRDNTKMVYNSFLQSPPSDGKILVACGLQEGIDLVGPAGRWQVILKVPYPSLGDHGVRTKADEDPEWFAWQAIKLILQASGRVSRNESDYGETYIYDSQFLRLWKNHQSLMPLWFRGALHVKEE